MDAVVQRGDPWTGRITCRRADGTEYEDEVTASPIRTAGGRVMNFVVVRRDITREVLMEAQLRQSQKMEAFGMLAGGVAHDFNNLLQLMLSYSKVLLMRKESDDPDRAELDGIVRAAKRGANLTGQLLAFSRKQVLKPRLINMGDAVRATASMIERLLGDNIAVDIIIHPRLGHDPRRPGTVRAGDPQPRRQRARRHAGRRTPDAGDQAAVRPGAPPWAPADIRGGPYACLLVSDTGVGMDQRILQRIFEPFFTTKGVGKGTGLGLSMVYGIVKQSNGHIGVQSQPGSGHLVCHLLPAAHGRRDGK